MIISFSGLDGSGKTTNALFVIDYLKKKGKRRTYYHLQHRSLFAITGNFLKKIYPKTREIITKKEFDREDKSYSKLIIGLLRKITYILDLVIFFIESLSAKISNRVLVCDRYFYDLAVQSKYMMLFGKNFFNFYISIIPKPDIAFFLEVDEKTAFKRAKERDIDFFKIKKRIYDSLNVDFIKIKVDKRKDVQKKVKDSLDDYFLG